MAGWQFSEIRHPLILQSSLAILILLSSGLVCAAVDKSISVRELKYYVATDGNDSNPGTVERPWATIGYAAERAVAGAQIIVRGGTYVLSRQVRLRTSGLPNAWIEFGGYPGETPILDAKAIARPSPTALSNGAFQIEGVAYIRVTDLTVINSHDAGITVRDSAHVDLINNKTDGTFSSGIAVWDTLTSERTLITLELSEIQ